MPHCGVLMTHASLCGVLMTDASLCGALVLGTRKAAVASLFGPQPSPTSPQDQRTTLPLAEPHCPLVVATHSCIEALTRVHSASPCMEQLYKRHESHSTGTTIDGP